MQHRSMQRLAHRKILLGISGGIAAYKSADLVRRLKDAGADVRVVMTEGAQAFITPLTMQALSGRPVHTELLDTEAEAAMGHIELARWADAILVAPASADVIARLAGGQADDLLTTLFLASRAPKFLAPAMNQAMWADPATQRNIATLEQQGMRMLGPAEGSQACGDVGPGRMLEAIDIAERLADGFQRRLLDGLRVTITAGPTREPIDPVRYISNHSSGKMGYALAQAMTDAGARVTLISGPVTIEAPESCHLVNVTTAQEMLDAAQSEPAACDVFIACAAVADYRVDEVASQKIKKSADSMQLALVKNPDILQTIAAADDAPFCVGFAAETQSVVDYARDKLQRKRLQMIVANDVSRSDIGFGSEENAVIVIDAAGEYPIAQAGKAQIARQLTEMIAQRLQEHRGTSG